MASDGDTQAAINCVAEVHKLSSREREMLVRVITGVIPGNRDRPLFALAVKLYSTGYADLFSMMLPEVSGLRTVDKALLDFLITVALDSSNSVNGFFEAFDVARTSADPARTFTKVLSATLHAYRVRALPHARHHNVFAAVRRFLARFRPDDPSPRDGDAPHFWLAEGRKDFLTRYVTALNAIADYAEAIVLATSWQESVVLDVADAIATTGSQQSMMLDDDSLGPDRLAASLALLSDAPVKLLLAHERDALAELGEYSSLVLRWPGDVQAALTHGPVQAAITQVLRRSGAQIDMALMIEKGPSRQDVVKRIEELNASLSACLHLIHQSITPADETGSVRSTRSAVYTSSITAMKRRQGFAQLSDAKRGEVLTGLIEPVLLMARVLERYQRAWERFGPDAAAELERKHREVFRDKLTEMYGREQTD